ncbi:MAG TPA: nucleoside-diphosphate kinase [Solirubrobacterales bacterium]|nr:nucleoside-diphosphate kinase [Solirubrobacterales bacterium]
MAEADFLTDLTVLPEKAQRYREEVFCREAWRDVEAAAGDRARELLHRHGLILFKPDGIAAGVVGEALDILGELGFEPAAGAVVQLDRHSTRWLWLYRFNVASVERVWLHDRINCSGPSLLVALRDRRAVPGETIPAAVRITDCKGPSRPERRRADQLRTRLGVDDRLLNFVHTSDEPADVVRELGILLTSSERRLLLRQIVEGGVWTRWFAQRRSLLAGKRHRDLWDAIRAEAGEIEFDEPGVEEQTLGDAPPAEWLASGERACR